MSLSDAGLPRSFQGRNDRRRSRAVFRRGNQYWRFLPFQELCENKPCQGLFAKLKSFLSVQPAVGQTVNRKHSRAGKRVSEVASMYRALDQREINPRRLWHGMAPGDHLLAGLLRVFRQGPEAPL